MLADLKAAGLGSLPGGGAEVFADRVRRLVAPGKEHPDNWIATHRAAHGMGIPTHCTMLYGHVETYEERVDHWLRLRDLQDETGGFLAFIPLPFHPENTVFQRRGWTLLDRRRRPEDDRRLAPDARQHPEHQGLLDHDLDAARAGRPALRRERHPGHGDGGADRPRRPAPSRRRRRSVAELVALIREAGRIPVQRDTLYNARAARLLICASAGSRYANMAPVFYDLGGVDVEQVSGVPTQLNRMLIAGEIDVAPISSIEYARNADG